MARIPLSCKDRRGFTLLHLASERKNLQLASIFVKVGVEIDAQNNRGETALFVACKVFANDVARMLIDKGASMDL